jgi:hypothetical protein
MLGLLVLAFSLSLLAFKAPQAVAQASFGGQNLYPWNNIYNQRIDHRTGYDDIGLWWNSTALIDLLDGDGTRTLGFSVFSVDTVGSCPTCVTGFMPVTRDYSNATWTWVAFDTVLAAETDTCSTTKSWSDQALYPWDSSTPFEQGTGNTDRHMITFYTTGSKVYEVYRALYPGGTYARGCNGQIWDATINNKAMGRGESSTDESGQPILQGLCQYAEAASGVPKHALRINLSANLMNGRKMSNGLHAPADTLEGHLYLWPARKGAFNPDYDSSENTFPFGALLRLKPTLSFSTTGWPTAALNIVKELQEYGAYVADIAGGTDKVSLIGTANETEPATFRYYLKKILLTDFEVVDQSVMQANEDSLRAVPLCHSADPNDPCSGGGGNAPGDGGGDFSLVVQELGSATLISFNVPIASPVRVSIIDVQGRSVAVLAAGIMSPGRHEVRWSTRPAPGVYFALVQGGPRSQSRRIVIR